MASSKACPSKAPALSDSCALCDFCDTTTISSNCSGHGTCSSGACSCDDSWGGLTCNIPLTCTAGVVDARGQCCASSVVDLQGRCCEKSGNVGPVVDAAGACCAGGRVDACGVCGGSAIVVDAIGTCCAVRSIIFAKANHFGVGDRRFKKKVKSLSVIPGYGNHPPEN